VREEIEELFLSLKAETAPTAIDYDWGPFVRRINQLESQHRFLSVKWLNEKKFADDPALQEALQIAIKNGILELYSIDNPNNPDFKTSVCRLIRGHPTVRKILQQG
jgi:hypothetical protein